MSKYLSLIGKIEQRKAWIISGCLSRYGTDFNFSTEIASDLEINNLYEELEKYINKIISIQLFEYQGKKYTLHQLAKLSNINPSTLYSRIKLYRFTVEEAVTRPVHVKLQMYSMSYTLETT